MSTQSSKSNLKPFSWEEFNNDRNQRVVSADGREFKFKRYYWPPVYFGSTPYSVMGTLSGSDIQLFYDDRGIPYGTTSSPDEELFFTGEHMPPESKRENVIRFTAQFDASRFVSNATTPVETFDESKVAITQCWNGGAYGHVTKSSSSKSLPEHIQQQWDEVGRFKDVDRTGIKFPHGYNIVFVYYKVMGSREALDGQTTADS